MKKVAVIMGSDSDLPLMQGALDMLGKLNIPCEAHIYSAHRTPDAAADFARNARAEGFGAIIAGAPIKSSTLDGLDALLSTVQMPSGMPVATVAIDGAANAALLAAQILAVSDDTIAQKLEELRARQTEAVLLKDRALQEQK